MLENLRQIIDEDNRIGNINELMVEATDSAIMDIFIDEDGEEFARGIINYNSEDTNKIIGKHSDSILEILGYKNYDALITRDYIVLL